MRISDPTSAPEDFSTGSANLSGANRADRPRDGDDPISFSAALDREMSDEATSTTAAPDQGSAASCSASGPRSALDDPTPNDPEAKVGTKTGSESEQGQLAAALLLANVPTALRAPTPPAAESFAVAPVPQEDAPSSNTVAVTAGVTAASSADVIAALPADGAATATPGTEASVGSPSAAPVTPAARPSAVIPDQSITPAQPAQPVPADAAAPNEEIPAAGSATPASSTYVPQRKASNDEHPHRDAAASPSGASATQLNSGTERPLVGQTAPAAVQPATQPSAVTGPSASAQVSEAIRRVDSFADANGRISGHRLTLRLAPEALGEVSIHLRAGAGGATLDIRGSDAAIAALSSEHKQLVRSLEQILIPTGTDGKVNVSFLGQQGPDAGSGSPQSGAFGFNSQNPGQQDGARRSQVVPAEQSPSSQGSKSTPIISPSSSRAPHASNLDITL